MKYRKCDVRIIAVDELIKSIDRSLDRLKSRSELMRENAELIRKNEFLRDTLRLIYELSVSDKGMDEKSQEFANIINRTMHW